MKKKPSFSLIVCAYNEGDILEGQIRQWVYGLQKFTDDFEIILVDDGSTDLSGEIADRLASEFCCLKVIHHNENLGVGHAAQTARQNVIKDYVFWNDVDGHFDINDLGQIIPFLENYDIVAAFKHNMINTKTPFCWLKSRVNYYLIKILFMSPIKDFQFVQFFPREFFCDGIFLKSHSSFIPAECLIKARCTGLTIKQVQIKYHSHHSKLRPSKCSNFKIIMQSIKDIFSFWLYWVFLGGAREAKEYWINKFGDELPWRK